MLSRGLNLALRLSPHRAAIQSTAKNSTAPATESMNDKDPAPYFFNKDVQTLLKVVTRPEPDKVFRRRLDGRKLETPLYQFMTEEDLQKAMDKANYKMARLLQMPPVVKVRKENSQIISKDPALQGLLQCKIVITDITFGISNKNRTIAVREQDGTLRNATYDECDRFNQIYFPMKGREVYPPKMFQEENLQPILERGDYQFILDRACTQYDPDHPDFHRVVHATYDYVDEKDHHDNLRSTRHFGPMVFYLAWNKKIDKLLIENIRTERMEDAALVVRLYYMLHQSENVPKEEDHVKLLQYYIKTELGSKRELDNILKTYLEIEKERQKLKEHQEKEQGITSSSKNLDT